MLANCESTGSEASRLAGSSSQLSSSSLLLESPFGAALTTIGVLMRDLSSTLGLTVDWDAFA